MLYDMIRTRCVSGGSGAREGSASCTKWAIVQGHTGLHFDAGALSSLVLSSRSHLAKRIARQASRCLWASIEYLAFAPKAASERQGRRMLWRVV